MIMKIEYFMLNGFSEKEFYSIEYKDGDYYYSNNLMTNFKLKKEIAHSAIQYILGNLSILYKEPNKDVSIDRAEGRIKVFRSDGSIVTYSSDDYSFKPPRAYLKDLNSKIMRLEI